MSLKKLSIIGLILFITLLGKAELNTTPNSISTPLLVKGFETKYHEFINNFNSPRDPQKGELDFNNFSVEFTERRVGKDSPDRTIFNANPTDVLEEVVAVYKNKFGLTNVSEINALSEFQRIKMNLLQRNYEIQFQPSKNIYPNSIKINYNLPINKQSLTHEMNFEYSIIFHKKDGEFKPFEEYPKAFLRGQLKYLCNKEVYQCRVTHADIFESGIKWMRGPGGRGGSSSAGGE